LSENDEFKIERATRKSSRLRLALCGTSGGGKTMTMLRIAGGLAQAMIDMKIIAGPLDGKIGIIDTEQKSARLYADAMLPDGTRIPPFDVLELRPPYTTERYIKALRSMEISGHVVIGIDQLSHAWAGQGGLLEKLATIAKKDGNTWKAFDDITPEQNRFLEDLLATPAHLIVSMRSKTAWVTEEYTDKQGNKRHRPKRIGMAPIQRAGAEYEFTSLLNLDTEGNVATTLKDRTGVFPMEGVIGRMTEKHGATLAQWLYTASPAEEAGRDMGSPLERLEARVATWVGKFEKCLSLPDLARAFELATSEARAFQLDLEARRAAVDRLIAAKEARKAELTPQQPSRAHPAGTRFIGPEDVAQLEGMLQRAGIGAIEWQEKLGVVRLTQLPAAELDEARDWIDSEVVLRGAAA
jgi:hypothetical protein